MLMKYVELPMTFSGVVVEVSIPLAYSTIHLRAPSIDLVLRATTL